ncbi:MAG: chemotaxis protein CheA [Phycisphaerales bacterium]|nr:chemotaxis protein CheA [Phycisphaerales bacterium]
MSIQDFDPEILQDFITESGELLEQLEGDLVELESNPNDLEMLNQVFRALHTIKGSASFLALTNLVAIAHCTESALNAARNEEIVIGKDEMDLLLEAIDVLKVQFDQLISGENELTAAKPELVAALTALGDGKKASPTDDTQAADPEATTTTGDQPAEQCVDGMTTRPLEFDSSKIDLIDHLASDIQDTIEQAQIRITQLIDESARPAAICNLGELCEDLVKTIDFFDIHEMMQIATALAKSLEGMESLTTEQFTQLTPRMLGATVMLKEQNDALTDHNAIGWDADTFLDNLQQAANGETPDGYALPVDCDATGALRIDGIKFSGDNTDTTDDTNNTNQIEPTRTTESTEATPTPSLTVESKPSTTGASPNKPKPAAIEQTIRVEVGRLESLMNLVGELVLQKNRVSAMAEDVQKSSMDMDMIEQIEVTADTLDRITGDIQVAVMRTRMQPLDKLFGKYPRLIRDLAKKTSKNINLVIEGGDTEVDRSVIEELGDPLVHLLRNSGDHGIESPEDRIAAGKPAQGTIKLVAGHEGSHVCVKIIDDGKGLDRDVIGNKAVERGLVSKDQLDSLSDEDVFRFILEAGFSTADQVSDLSGRGVGMDVVRTNIERKLKGGLIIESIKGEGMTLTITIPLTIAIMPAMMVAVGDEIFAIPLANITEIVRPAPNQLSSLGEEPVIHLRGSVYPLISAQEVFNLPQSGRDEEPFVVVIGFNQKITGLRVTRVIGQQEIVIKPLEGVKRSGPISGATVRSDGGVSLIIDIAELMRAPMNNRSTLSAV